MTPGLGMKHGCSQRKVVILIDEETFVEIRADAVKRKRSLAFVMREMIELGLETSKQ